MSLKCRFIPANSADWVARDFMGIQLWYNLGWLTIKTVGIYLINDAWLMIIWEGAPFSSLFSTWTTGCHVKGGQNLDSIRNNYDLMVYSWEYLGFTTNYNKTLDDNPVWGMVINRGFGILFWCLDSQCGVNDHMFH